MKQIVAIVKPFLAEKLLQSLSNVALEAVQVREAKGFGRQKSYLDQYTDTEFSTAFLPKIEITIWIEDDDQVDAVIETIVDATRTGRIGDGKIFVLPVSQCACECFTG